MAPDCAPARRGGARLRVQRAVLLGFLAVGSEGFREAVGGGGGVGMGRVVDFCLMERLTGGIGREEGKKVEGWEWGGNGAHLMVLSACPGSGSWAAGAAGAGRASRSSWAVLEELVETERDSRGRSTEAEGFACGMCLLVVGWV